MSTRRAVSSTAATHAASAIRETLRNSAWFFASDSVAQSALSVLARMIARRTYETAMSTPAMKTNGATRATKSLACAPGLVASPPVDGEFPAMRPATTVPIHPPPAVSAVQGWLATAQSTPIGPYTALTAMTIHAVA